MAWAVELKPAGATGHSIGGLAVDDLGHAVVAGYSNFGNSDWDLVVTRYDPSGAMQWQTRTGGASTRDFASSVALHAGNVFVAGSSFNPDASGSFQTVKFSPDGTVAWKRLHRGPSGGNASAKVIAIDALGNAIVGGDSLNERGDNDFTVVKYDPAGEALWTFHYDGPGQMHDELVTLKVDAEGNVGVVGNSPGVGGNSSFVTLKLNAAGQLLWVYRHEMPVDFVEGTTARDLAIDSEDNLISVGNANGGFLALRHSPSGALLWARCYQAEEPASLQPVAVRVDPSNHIVIAGNLYGSGTNDSIVAKYAPSGQLQWVSRVPHPVHQAHITGLALDHEGNSYLTGSPYLDARTLKIDPRGNLRWTVDYNSTESYFDFGEAIAVNATGDVFIAGRSVYFGAQFVSLVKYRQFAPPGEPPGVTVSPVGHLVAPGTQVTFTANPTGPGPFSYQWQFTGRPIAGASGPELTLSGVRIVDRGDYSVRVTGPTGTTVSPEARLTVLMKPSVSVMPTQQISVVGGQAGFRARFDDQPPFDGNFRGTGPFTYQWRRENIDLPGETNAALRLRDLGVDQAGLYSVVVRNPAGAVTSSVAALTISRAVEPQAVTRIHGSDLSQPSRPLLRITAAGERIVAAVSKSIETGNDIGVWKYGPNDQLLWSARYGRAGADPDVPSDLAIDPAGNIYVAGSSGWPYNGRTFTVLKYSPSGALQWARHLVETNALDALATAVAVDAAGNLTVAGRAGLVPVVQRYTPTGDLRWESRFEASDYEHKPGVAVNRDGETYMATAITKVSSAFQASDLVIRKLSPDGRTLWSRTVDSGGPDYFSALTLDQDENIIAVGTSIGSDDYAVNAAVHKFTPDGTHLWSTNVGRVPGSDDREFGARAVASDRNNHVVILVGIEYDDESRGTLVARLDPAGRTDWSALEPDLESDQPQMAVDVQGGVYFAGRQFQAPTGYDMVTVKYGANGSRRWSVSHAAPGISWDSGTAVAIDPRGDVSVLGESTPQTGLNTDLLLVRYRQTDLPAPPSISLVRENDGSYRLIPPSGGDFVIEASSDLIQWARPAAGEIDATFRLQANQPRRFYRAVDAATPPPSP